MDILKLLDDNNSIKDYEVQDYRYWSDGFYFKLKIRFYDGSELFAREYMDSQERDYSFHWQTADMQLIIRWDNAPHHQYISTYPHHKHTSDGIFESTEISLEDVIASIKACAIDK